MKKFIILCVALCISLAAIAAQPKSNSKSNVRKVPFLPYAGVATTYQPYYAPAGVTRASAGGAVARPFTNGPIRKSYETIFFEEDSAKIREDQFAKVKRLAHRLSNEGSYFYSIVIFTTPEIDSALAHARSSAIIAALEDFGIRGEPNVFEEYKAHPILNPNRVEVHMHSLGLGSTIRK